MKFMIQWYPICGVYLQPFGREILTDRQTLRKKFSKGYLQIFLGQHNYLGLHLSMVFSSTSCDIFCVWPLEHSALRVFPYPSDGHVLKALGFPILSSGPSSHSQEIGLHALTSALFFLEPLNVIDGSLLFLPSHLQESVLPCLLAWQIFETWVPFLSVAPGLARRTPIRRRNTFILKSTYDKSLPVLRSEDLRVFSGWPVIHSSIFRANSRRNRNLSIPAARWRQLLFLCFGRHFSADSASSPKQKT